MNAFSLSQRLGLDLATVTMFAQRPGYAGYQELLCEIQAMVKKELKVAYKPPVEKYDEEGLLLQALGQEKKNLHGAMTRIKGDTVTEVVRALRAARNAYIVAQGAATDRARMFVLHLRGLLRMPAQLVAADMLEAPVFLSSLGGEDVVIGVSLAAVAADTVYMLRLARPHGARTTGLAASHTSPTASAADLTIVYSSESTTVIPSAASLTSIVTALFQVIASKELERLNSFKDGFQKSLNWLLGDKEEEKNEDAQVLMQF